MTPYGFYELAHEKKKTFIDMCGCPVDWVAVLEQRIATVSDDTYSTV